MHSTNCSTLAAAKAHSIAGWNFPATQEEEHAGAYLAAGAAVSRVPAAAGAVLPLATQLPNNVAANAPGKADARFITWHRLEIETTIVPPQLEDPRGGGTVAACCAERQQEFISALGSLAFVYEQPRGGSSSSSSRTAQAQAERRRSAVRGRRAIAGSGLRHIP